MVAISSLQQPSSAQNVTQSRNSLAQNALSGTDRLPGQRFGSVDEARQNLLTDRLSRSRTQEFSRSLVRQQSDASNTQALVASSPSIRRPSNQLNTNRLSSRNTLNTRQTANRTQPQFRPQQNTGVRRIGQQSNSARTNRLGQSRVGQNTRVGGGQQIQNRAAARPTQQQGLLNRIESAASQQTSPGSRINILA